MDSRCHGVRGALGILLEATSDGDILRYTLLVKGVGIAFVASEEGPFPTHSASQSLEELQGTGLLEPRVC